jgi:hypothetical protein
MNDPQERVRSGVAERAPTAIADEVGNDERGRKKNRLKMKKSANCGLSVGPRGPVRTRWPPR